MNTKILINILIPLSFCTSGLKTKGQTIDNQTENTIKKEGQDGSAMKRGFLPKEYEKYDHSRRNKIEKPDEVIEYIGINPGMKIGEAGSGRGYFTFYLSAKVGENGIIYANDISEHELSALDFYAKEFGISKNIVSVLGKIDDPEFPADDLDMIVTYHSFHDFEKKKEWLTNARKYLKHGGRLVIIDSYNPKHTKFTFRKVNKIVVRANFRLLFHKKFYRHVQIYIMD